MGFRHSYHRHQSSWGRRPILVNTAAIIFLLKLLVTYSVSKPFFCHGRKAPSSLSTSFFSLKKPSETPTASRDSPVLLGAVSNQNQIAAWVPRQAPRRNPVPRSNHCRLPPCVGYYIPSPTAFGSRRRNRRSPLFSSNRNGNDNFSTNDNDHNIEDRDNLSTGDVKNPRSDDNSRRRIGILSFLSDFSYGVNRVNKDFLGLTWRVYSRTILWMTPLLVLLFIILPACSTSSSPFLQIMATRVQGFLKGSFECLAKGSRLLFVRPMHGLVQWIVSFSSTRSFPAQASAWKTRSSLKNTLLWGLFWGPIVEEFIFRFAFRGLWKVLFRPISIGSTNKHRTSISIPSENKRFIRENSILVGPVAFLNKILSSRRTSDSAPEPNPMYTNRSWRIASGICFGIAHFSNFFPIDTAQYSFEGEIRLPSGTRRERFLLGLFPNGFTSTHKEFCLTSMVLTGAIYQATHCFFSTMLLYGPLLDAPKSQKGGIFAAIGAHIAWNANVIWFVTNIKLRLLCKLFFFKPQKMSSSNND